MRRSEAAVARRIAWYRARRAGAATPGEEMAVVFDLGRGHAAAVGRADEFTAALAAFVEQWVRTEQRGSR